MLEPPSDELVARLFRASCVPTPTSVARGASSKRLAADLPAFDSVWLDALSQLDKLTPFQVQILESKSPERLEIGPYVLRDRLGGGTTGETFLAVDRSTGARVALKRIALGPWLDSARLGGSCEFRTHRVGDFRGGLPTRLVRDTNDNWVIVTPRSSTVHRSANFWYGEAVRTGGCVGNREAIARRPGEAGATRHPARRHPFVERSPHGGRPCRRCRRRHSGIARPRHSAGWSPRSGTLRRIRSRADWYGKAARCSFRPLRVGLLAVPTVVWTTAIPRWRCAGETGGASRAGSFRHPRFRPRRVSTVGAACSRPHPSAIRSPGRRRLSMWRDVWRNCVRRANGVAPFPRRVRPSRAAK